MILFWLPIMRAISDELKDWKFPTGINLKMLDKEQIAGIVDFAEAYPAISAIYLFGSHASGHEKSRSDIDLGVLFNEDVDGFTRIHMETALSNHLKKDVDLVDMGKSSPFLRHQIYKSGKLLYRDGSDFSFIFRANSIRDYLDTNFLRRQRMAIVNKMKSNISDIKVDLLSDCDDCG
ncbi:MAG: nucleotidyltransferase domain-containing protein [Deltaproteobacteria bacterium]|nr:nucleotidyltransferase domain-containing protein [Deltaproteobacteria bacterium]